MDLKLEFWGSGTARTLRPIWMAEELNLKYELNPIGPRTGETLTPEYSALNPKQKIPLIKHGDFLLSESVAICRYLQSISSTKITHSPENRQIQAKEDEWCNPNDRALGEPSTCDTTHNKCDAYLWIKIPGESDGRCNGGPKAGRWWGVQAEELVKNFLNNLDNSK